MSALVILIIISMVVSGSFLVAFLWSVKSGQYDDNYSPANRILFSDEPPTTPKTTKSNNKTQNK